AGGARGGRVGGARGPAAARRLPGARGALGRRGAPGARAGGVARRRRGPRGRGVGGVEAGALEDDPHRVEDLAQRLLRALRAGSQRVLAEALVLLETMASSCRRRRRWARGILRDGRSTRSLVGDRDRVYDCRGFRTERT